MANDKKEKTDKKENPAELLIKWEDGSKYKCNSNCIKIKSRDQDANSARWLDINVDYPKNILSGKFTAC